MSRLPEGADVRGQVALAVDALCEWATDTVAASVPRASVDKAALVLVDNLGATAAARAEPEIAELRNATATPGHTSAHEATILLPGGPMSDRRGAAFLNGVAGCWCELDEGYRGAPAHAGVYIVPALLAEAEATGASLERVLVSLAVAYEVVARFAEAWSFPSMTVHPHAALGGIGATLGVGLVRGSPPPVLAAAVRIASGLVPAGSYAAAVEGALVRNLWTGQGAVTGFNAVDWAQAGLSGHDDGPGPGFGLMNASLDVTPLLKDLGDRWAILTCYHKLHGCCHSTHAAVEAALDLRQRIVGRPPSGIDRLDLFTHRPTMSNPKPGNTLAARFSFEHVVAATLVLGHADPEAFSRQAIGDDAIARLRSLVRLHPYEPLPAWPLDRAARLTVSFADGGTETAECLSAPGGPDRPLSKDDLLTKAERLAGGAFPNFVEVAQRLAAADRATLQVPWRDLVRQLTAA